MRIRTEPLNSLSLLDIDISPPNSSSEKPALAIIDPEDESSFEDEPADMMMFPLFPIAESPECMTRDPETSSFLVVAVAVGAEEMKRSPVES